MNKMQTKWVHRLNLMFDFDEGQQIDNRRKLAWERRDMHLYAQDMDNLIDKVQSKIQLNLPMQMINKIVMQTFVNKKQNDKKNKKEETVKEVSDLYVYMATRFIIEYNKVQDVD